MSLKQFALIAATKLKQVTIGTMIVAIGKQSAVNAAFRRVPPSTLSRIDMLVTQTIADLGIPFDKIKCIGVYYDECTLRNDQGFGKSVFEHVEALKQRSARKMIVNARFAVKLNDSSHQSYNLITVSITGDEVLLP